MVPARLAVLLLLAALPARAAMTVEFDIQPRALAVGESVNCTFTIRGLDNPPVPQLPPIDGFQVAGPNRSFSSQMSMVNGKTVSDSSVTFSYQLIPMKAGRFTIGPFRYAAQGQSVQLPAVEVQVAGPAAAPGAAAGGQQGPALLARLSAPRTTVYNQEVFDLEVSILSSGLNLGRDIQLLNLPSAGLSLDQFEELQPTRQVINNMVYDVRRFRTRVNALTAGKFRLEPTLRVNILTRTKGRSPFDNWLQGFGDPFFTGVQAQPVNVAAEPLDIEVKPLPAEGRPASFSGAVGRFNFEVEVKPTELAVGEPVTITTTITGEGNIENVTAPQIVAGDNFKIYESRLLSKDIAPARAAGRKVFEQVVLPRSTEAKEIPAASFSFFDPVAATYRTVTRGPFALALRPSSNVTARLVQSLPAALQPQAQILGTDIVYLKPMPYRWIATTTAPWYTRPFFLGLQAVPFAAVAAVFVAVRRRQDLARDVAKARRQKAPKSARAGLRRAEQALARNDRIAFFESVWEALSSYFGNRLNLSPGEITAEVVLPAMKAGGLTPPACQELEALFRTCERERFGRQAAEPGADTQPGDFSGMLDTLNRLLRQCEKVRL